MTTEKEPTVLLFGLVGVFFAGWGFFVILLSLSMSFYPWFAVCYFLPALIAIVHITELISSGALASTKVVLLPCNLVLKTKYKTIKSTMLLQRFYFAPSKLLQVINGI